MVINSTSILRRPSQVQQSATSGRAEQGPMLLPIYQVLTAQITSCRFDVTTAYRRLVRATFNSITCPSLDACDLKRGDHYR